MLERVRTVKLTTGWRETHVHGGSDCKGSHGANFGEFTGWACLEREEENLFMAG